MTVLRADAWPAHADEPYGPIIRAIGPTLLALPDDELRGPARTRDVRGRPAPARARPATRGDRREDRRGAVRPPPSVGRRGRSRASSALLGRLGERQPVVLVLEDLHLADAATRALVTFLARISRDQRLAIIGTHQPDVVARDDPWTGGSCRDHDRLAARPVVLPPLDRDELAALIEGIEGERASASLLLLVAERSGGLPLVAEELLAARRELPSGSLTGSFDELVIARLAVRSRECRRVLRLLPWPSVRSRRELAAVAAAFELDTSRAAPRSVTRPAGRRRRARRGPVGRPDGGARQRLPGRARRGGSRSATIDRQGRRRRPPADRADALPRGPRKPRRAALGHRLALAGGARSACSPLGRHRGGRVRGPGTPPPTSWRARARPVAARRPAPAPAAAHRRSARRTGSICRSALRGRLRRPYRHGPPPSSRRPSAGSTPAGIASSWASSMAAWVSSGGRPSNTN